MVVFAHSMSHTWRNSGRLLADCIMIFRKTAQNKERVDLDRIRKCAACCGIPSPEILLAAFSEYLPGCPVKKTDFPENMVNMFREIVENGDALSTVDYTVP